MSWTKEYARADEKTAVYLISCAFVRMYVVVLVVLELATSGLLTMQLVHCKPGAEKTFERSRAGGLRCIPKKQNDCIIASR